MLKIKDDVELNELEKFGFKLVKRTDTEFLKIDLKTSGNEAFLKIQPISREIIINAHATYILNLDILYDLIQAGLVEKREE